MTMLTRKRKQLNRLSDHFESLSVSPSEANSSGSSNLATPRRSARLSRTTSTSNIIKSSPIKMAMKRRRRRVKRITPPKSKRAKSKRIKGEPLLMRKAKHIGESSALPGRESEFEIIRDKIRESLETEQGCCIYISGVPGTGKTATVHCCINALYSQYGNNEFDFVEINGMKLSDPRDAYSLLWKHLNGASLSGAAALRRLSRRFTESPKPLYTHLSLFYFDYFRIVLLDEFDLLLKSKSSILYHFFEWSGWERSKLIIIAIANTMDLPERYLSNKIASRMGNNRINFKPYTYPQLMTIIKHQKGDWINLFHPDALEYCARKVSAISGDARRALNLASRAVEWSKGSIQSTNLKLITIPIMDRAIQMTISGNTVQIIQDLSYNEQLLLLAIILVCRESENSFCSLSKVFERHLQVSRANLKLPITFGDFQSAFIRLERQKLVRRIDRDENNSFGMPFASLLISLLVPQEEASNALKSCTIFHKYLQQL